MSPDDAAAEGSACTGARRVGVDDAEPVAPFNLARSAFHALSGIGWALLYCYGLSREPLLWVLGGTLMVFAADDVMRRWWPRRRSAAAVTIFRTLSRPSERRAVASSTWYTLAMFIGVAVFPRPAFVVGLMVLALADPAAGLVGRRFGRRTIIPGKTFAGCAAFLLVAGGVAWVGATWGQPDAALTARLGFTAAVAVVGMVAELLGEWVPDNLSVLLASGAVAALLW